MNIKKRQEVINLMPWYNLGKLSDAEKTMVDEALSEDASLREQLSLDQDIMSKVLADPKLLDRSAFESSDIRLDKVLSQIDETVVTKLASKPQVVAKEKQPSISMLTGVKSFFADLLAGSSHSFTYAVFAALTVVQLALLMFFVVPSTMQDNDFGNSDGFITSSDGNKNLVPEPAGSNIDSSLDLEIMMKDNIVIEGFPNESIGDLELELLPNSDGKYHIRPSRKLKPAEIEVIKNGLLDDTAEVKFASEGLQSQ